MAHRMLISWRDAVDARVLMRIELVAFAAEIATVAALVRGRSNADSRLMQVHAEAEALGRAAAATLCSSAEAQFEQVYSWLDELRNARERICDLRAACDDLARSDVENDGAAANT